MNIGQFLTTLFIITIAEVGDKTFLLTFGLGTRYPVEKIIMLIFTATGILMAVVVFLGGVINSYFPHFYVQLFAGILFIIFGFWMMLGKEKEEKGKLLRNSLWLVFITFLLAELGDKTQLAKLTLSAKYGATFSVWLGATLGMAGVDSLGALAGGWMKKHISEKMIRWIAFLVFIGFGLLTLGDLFLW